MVSFLLKVNYPNCINTENIFVLTHESVIGVYLMIQQLSHSAHNRHGAVVRQIQIYSVKKLKKLSNFISSSLIGIFVGKDEKQKSKMFRLDAVKMWEKIQ